MGSPGVPYPSSVTTSSNETLLYWSRERPKIFWDDSGKMTHLITAVAPEPDADEPSTFRYSSCPHGMACSMCKGRVFTETLIAELAVDRSVLSDPIRTLGLFNNGSSPM